MLNRTDAASAIPKNVDGVDLWYTLTRNRSATVRDSVPLNINKDLGYPNSGYQRCLVTQDGWKYIEQHVEGNTLNYDGYYTANGTRIPPPPNKTPGMFLFNINDDPTEHSNQYEPNLERVEYLKKLLAQYEEDYQDPQSNWPHPMAFPIFHNRVWAPFHHLLKK